MSLAPYNKRNTAVWISKPLMDLVAERAEQDARTLRSQVEVFVAIGLTHVGPVPDSARTLLAAAKERADDATEGTT